MGVITTQLRRTEASMNFISDLPLYKREKPYNCRSDSLPGGVLTNLVFETKTGVPVYNIRGFEKEFTLDENGFQFIEHESEVRSEIGTPEFVYEYATETIELLKKYFNTDKVISYDLRIRRNVDPSLVVGDLDDRSTVMHPVQDVHVDQTLDGGYQRIRRHIREDEVVDLSQDEWQMMIINVWRPLRHVVEDAPLAFCDYRSVDTADLLEADRVYETYNGEIYYMKHNDGQRWYWLDQQSPKEVSLFVSFISDPGEKAKFCPHVSFQNQEAPPGCPKRESVEVRAIVIRKKPTEATA